MSTPNTPTEAHLELAKNALFARDASGRLMTAQMVAQLLADSEARAVANAVAAIIEKNAPEIAKANAELTRLRADNLTAHQMACAAGLERDQLRAEVDALKQCIESGPRVLREDAERNAARAERAEADTARLNWLAVSDVWFDFPATGAFTPETMRAAIDAAMKP